MFPIGARRSIKTLYGVRRGFVKKVPSYIDQKKAAVLMSLGEHFRTNIRTKRSGTPIAPDKRMLLTVNKTTVTVNLNSWHNGGCPITFVIQYKSAGHHEWTLVSNNIIPEQQTITITDLTLEHGTACS
ncbi:fibronectin type-III domain-containing protein [Caerostris extrusa]|uniref:Fibronectin type-III domain-containing protein n=1 Tax=Caerostris extrusa TaxID=172846 RepID=A0AAV4QBC9_CAEEX|nr:fibronectin type-III domain-containing protein [Caerostris extrusa]